MGIMRNLYFICPCYEATMLNLKWMLASDAEQQMMAISQLLFDALNQNPSTSCFTVEYMDKSELSSLTG